MKSLSLILCMCIYFISIHAQKSTRIQKNDARSQGHISKEQMLREYQMLDEKYQLLKQIAFDRDYLAEFSDEEKRKIRDNFDDIVEDAEYTRAHGKWKTRRIMRRISKGK